MKFRSVDPIVFDAIVVHYGEVTLKRGKRGLFERILEKNLKRFTGAEVKRLQGRLLIELTPESDLETLVKKVGKVFGVVWYAPAVKASSLEELEPKILAVLRKVNANKVRVETRRSDKRFPITSLEVSRRLGESISRKLGLKIDLKNPDKTVFVEVTEDGIYASFEKLRGPGGLPLGSSGRLLGLFSGSKSALACWYMMKRGCSVDLLHVYEDSSADEILQADLRSIIDGLLEYSLRLKLYLASANAFEKWVENLSEDIKDTLFKLFVLKLGERISENKRYHGLVLGSTAGDPEEMKNLCAILSFRKIPVYTPLLGMEESEIGDKLKLMGLGGRYSLRERGREKREVDIGGLKALWKKCALKNAVEEAVGNIAVYAFKLGKNPKRLR